METAFLGGGLGTSTGWPRWESRKGREGEEAADTRPPSPSLLLEWLGALLHDCLLFIAQVSPCCAFPPSG